MSEARLVPLFRKVDCVSFPVSNLEQALFFYRDGLSHELIWRTPSAVGLRLPDTDTELVLHVEDRSAATELKVIDVPIAVERFCANGGVLVEGPFDIAIGRCAVVVDPDGNQLTLLDSSKGVLKVDAEGNVTGIR